jgi:hypothetical protein
VFAAFAHTAAAQQEAGSGAASAMRELLALKSSDGRSHAIEAIAIGRASHTDVLYAVERNSEPGFGGDGDFLLWRLDLSGKVLRKDRIAKMVSRGPPRVTIVPLPEPQGGAIIVGMFRERLGCSLLRVDASGRIETDRSLAVDLLHKAILLPDAKSLLLVGCSVGRERIDGEAWKIDFDGNMQWQKAYTHEFIAKGKRVARSLRDIALPDDKGDFVAVGEIGELYKMGLGRPMVWLLRCDAEGKVLCETTFPGNDPLMCSLGKGEFAIAYTDAGLKNRVRLVDLRLQQRWEKTLDITAAWIDHPAIASLPSGRGFVVAGARFVKGSRTPRGECAFFQYSANGQVVSASSAPLIEKVLLHPRAACGARSAYIAGATKGGFDPQEIQEAAIFEVPLVSADRIPPNPGAR